MALSWAEIRLDLIHAFTIAHGTSDHRINTVIRLDHDGMSGYGLAAPNPRYGETPATTAKALTTMASLLPVSPSAYVDIMATLNREIDGAYSAKAAMDMALFDLLGKQVGAPLHKLWGLNPAAMPPTSMTIGIDTPERVKAKVREVPQYKVLKVKLDGKDDRGLIRAIRDVSDQTLRVDANEGWRDRDEAIREIEWLATQGVELVEQAMPASAVGDNAWLKARSPLPLIADEAFCGEQNLDEVAATYHGINIKLMKCGGLQNAQKLIHLARHFDLQIMLGCMVASSLSIAAAAQLAPLVDFVDLDGHLLVGNDPFEALGLEDGRLTLSDRPGLGAVLRDGVTLDFRNRA